MLAATSSTLDRDSGILFPCLHLSLMICVGGEAFEPIASVLIGEQHPIEISEGSRGPAEL